MTAGAVVSTSRLLLSGAVQVSVPDALQRLQRFETDRSQKSHAKIASEQNSIENSAIHGNRNELPVDIERYMR